MAKNITSLTLSVMRDADGIDCTRNGISAQFDRLQLVGTCIDAGTVTAIPEGVGESIDRITAPVVLNIRNMMGVQVASIIPANWDEETHSFKAERRWVMAGGNYASFTDSRASRLVEDKLGAHFYGAIAIHDRIETETRSF